MSTNGPGCAKLCLVDKFGLCVYRVSQMKSLYLVSHSHFFLFYSVSLCLRLSISYSVLSSSTPPAKQALHPEPAIIQRPFDWQGGHPWPGEDDPWHQVTAHCLATGPHALFRLFFVPLTSFSFCSNKSDTQLRYRLFAPVVLSHCSPVCSSARTKNSLLAVY